MFFFLLQLSFSHLCIFCQYIHPSFCWQASTAHCTLPNGCLSLCVLPCLPCYHGWQADVLCSVDSQQPVIDHFLQGTTWRQAPLAFHRGLCCATKTVKICNSHTSWGIVSTPAVGVNLTLACSSDQTVLHRKHINRHLKSTSVAAAAVSATFSISKLQNSSSQHLPVSQQHLFNLCFLQLVLELV